MAGRGSGGNVIAALCSFFIPGLGQLLQGRPFVGLIHLAIDLLLWMFMLGWLMHIYSAYSAAVFDPYRLD
ncbi:hypothetical protein KOR42_00100 [Thalassoglobus neptunius]|uniref:TM2 domain protein n=1 Tax=Thalassoglobus neptunius TaxID=1938619 RepID=A0A5C5X0Y9_9PLAN|nr:hypothetical protein [Thalassoglobus neptunius]TWT56657.1 hypothetical protein KOR42_00100 [Thalassoglobus neptunius]